MTTVCTANHSQTVKQPNRQTGRLGLGAVSTSPPLMLRLSYHRLRAFLHHRHPQNTTASISIIIIIIIVVVVVTIDSLPIPI